MHKGFSLIELAFVLSIIVVLSAVGLPRLQPFLDRIATERAALEITTALAMAREGAIARSTRARLIIDADTLKIDRLKIGTSLEWEPWWRALGPRDHGVALAVSNPDVVFGPTGLGYAAANTKVVLRRGSHVETITVSRLGRVKRW